MPEIPTPAEKACADAVAAGRAAAWPTGSLELDAWPFEPEPLTDAEMAALPPLEVPPPPLPRRSRSLSNGEAFPPSGGYADWA